MILAIDPGGSTGYAYFENNKLLSVGTVGKEDVFKWLAGTSALIYVVENYRVRPPERNKGWNQSWYSPFALEVIGAVKYHTERISAKLTLQEPSVKPVGYGWAKIKPSKKKSETHHLDALAHGCYFLVKQGLIKPGELQLANGETSS